ncbi:KTSC domain-containing protein [Paraburkholderia caffeinilytica]|uniref:KTSC domain-containing protein n=1 Tax=Paraburkholderia caffeinilytica TaxID=1761016 RepID=UPI003DA1C5B7
MIFARLLDWLFSFLCRAGRAIVEGFADSAAMEMGLPPEHWTRPPAGGGASRDDGTLPEQKVEPPMIRLNGKRVSEVALRHQGQVLEIGFANGTLAWYNKVPQHVYARLVESTTPDEVFRRDIEDRYTLLGVGNPERDTASR